MTKKEMIDSIKNLANIYHNISTLGMKLPKAPDGAPGEIFWDTCQLLIHGFISAWRNDPRNDTGNRNVCGCDRGPSNMTHTENGACKKHDLWHVYQAGRMGATLYWTKYWDANNMGSVRFKYELEELEELTMPELKDIYNDLKAFTEAVDGMMASLPDALKYEYEQWQVDDDDQKRRKAMGYFKTLEELLNSDNPAIVRLAKGIKKEMTK